MAIVISGFFSDGTPFAEVTSATVSGVVAESGLRQRSLTPDAACVGR
jgi:hypothetical protein